MNPLVRAFEREQEQREAPKPKSKLEKQREKRRSLNQKAIEAAASRVSYWRTRTALLEKEGNHEPYAWQRLRDALKDLSILRGGTP